MPLLFFYIFAMISMIMREIGAFHNSSSESRFFSLINRTQPYAKICSGLVSAWIMLELAIRMWQSNRMEQRSAATLAKLEREEKWIILGQRAALVFVTFAFLSFFIPAIFIDDWLEEV